jgi:MazG family protein
VKNLKNSETFGALIELVKKLRSPEGCPWDREQTGETLKPHLIEEAHEVLEALDSDDPQDLCEELGDLLFQILFHSEIAAEQGDFDIYDVCRRIHKKMVIRHPHVFGDKNFKDSAELLRNWEKLKSGEKAGSGKKVEASDSILDRIPPSLPSLHVARLISAKASGTGFDWPDLEGIENKITEEINELNEAVDQGNIENIQEEVGDILFTAVNIARFLKIDPESALSKANQKFIGRFQALEQHFHADGKNISEASSDEMEEVWSKVKKGQA